MYISWETLEGGGEGVDSGVGRGDARYRFKKFNRRWGIEEAKE